MQYILSLDVIALALLATCGPTSAQTQDGFRDPLPAYRPKFRYWMPDASISADIIARDIRDLRAAGAGGLEFLPFYYYGAGEETFKRQGSPVPDLPDWTEYGFGTPAFVSLFKDSLIAAKEADLLVDYALGPNQGAGVPSEVSTPGLAVELLIGNTTITPSGSFSAPVPQAQQPSATILSGLSFMHPLEQFGRPNLTAVIAYQVLSESAKDNKTGTRTVRLNETSFIDLTPLVDDGTLEWTPPDLTKTWKIFSFWEAYTNQRSCDGGPNPTDFIGNGSWTVDHFSKTGAAHVTDFWDDYILSDNEIADLMKSVGKYAWEDSMEMLASLYWTPGLLDRFNNTHGYSLLPYLPLLFSSSNSWNGGLPVYDEVYAFENDTNVGNSIHNLDYRKVLNDGYQDYLSHFEEWSHSIGTEYSTQPAYNLPLQMLSDIPLVDAPEAESLGFAQSVDLYRQFCGPAHLANKSVISTELGAVNTAAYSLTIPNLLQQIKRSFAGGFTMNVIHGFPCSTTYPNTTWPGYTTFYYQFTDMWNQIQPAWQHMRDALDYVGRNQWVLQQGTPKVDLAFYLYASPWQQKTQYNSTTLQDLGFTYDYIGPDNLASSQAFIESKMLGAPAYKALIINQQSIASVQAVDALTNISALNFPIFIVGPAPNQSYPVNASSQDALDGAIAQLLMSENVYRTGNLEYVPKMLVEHGIMPRVALNCSSNPVYPVWRSAGEVDYIYFFNDQNTSTQCTATVNASNVDPYIYDAWSGSQSPLLRYTTNNATLSVPLALKSNETLILALRHSTPPKCTFTSSSDNLYSLNSSSGRVQALITGPTTLTSSSGKTSTYNTTLPPPNYISFWDLVIENWHSAADRYAVQTEVTNYTYGNLPLVPWSVFGFDNSLNAVSGVGHYSSPFTVPVSSTNSSKLIGILSVPVIQHTARIFINGEWIGPVDPVNPTVTLANLEGGKTYELRIDWTTTLFNRVKAEANQTMVVAQVAGVVQGKYAAMPYEEYGMTGNVIIKWAELVDVEC